MTLPALAAERERLQQISIDSWYAAPHGAQQQTSRMPPLLSIDGTDRPGDGRKDRHQTVT